MDLGRDLSDSLRGRTSVPVHLFYVVVEGRVLDGDELVRNLGRDRVVSMRGRVLGGSRNVSPIPGEWTCPGWVRSGCWPTKNTCFRCGTARPNSPLPPWPVLNNSRPARAPREQRHPGRVPGNSASGCPTERRTPPPQASSAPPPPSVPAAEGLNLDLVFQFFRGLNVPPAVLAEIQNSVPPPAPKKTAQQITEEQRCSQLRSKVDMTKQQLAKLTKRVEALAEEHTEVAEKVVAKQTELAQLEVEMEGGGERRLRQFLRHERLTVAMALAENLHHSRQKVEGVAHVGPRAQKTARATGERPGAS